MEISTLAFSTEGKNAKGCPIMVNVVPGYPEDKSALWIKIAGICGIIVSTNAIFQEHHITEGEIEVGCDNVEA